MWFTYWSLYIDLSVSQLVLAGCNFTLVKNSEKYPLLFPRAYGDVLKWLVLTKKRVQNPKIINKY